MGSFARRSSIPKTLRGKAAVNARNIFTELKRRNVYKVAIAYAVVAWLVIQIATQVFPFFEIPNWTVRLVVLLLAIGFPIALIIAWAFEATPEGIKRTEVADAAGQRSRGGPWIYIVLIGAALSVGLFFFGRYTAPARSEAKINLPEKSVAVLPFDNLSRDPDNAYFTEGIQEEILTRLAKIADLKVISRTSTQRFKSAPQDLRQIAKQLGVMHVLEGSVQRSGDQVRVNVQLVNAMTEAHLWAEIYDRKLTDIFTVESDIAKTIAETLRAKLTGAEAQAIARRPTENTEAYELYLRGRYFWNKRTGANLKKAIDYFQQAIENDPSYALAYAGLADAYVLLPIYAATLPRDDVRQGLAAARKAVELDGTLAEAHTSLANALGADMQVAESIKEFQRAIALNLNYATAHQWYGEALQSDGQFDEAVAELRRAQELDPLSLIINASLGGTLVSAHRYDDAIEQLRKTIEMDPTFYVTHWFLGDAFRWKGDLSQAIAEYEKAAQLDPDPVVLGVLGYAYATAGRNEDARKLLDKLTRLSEQRYVPAYPLAVIHLALGDKDEALRWLEKSYQDHADDVRRFIKVEPLLDPLRGDPRFEALVQKVFPPNQ
jgi:TolB-like protein/Tfp pilus assembly protein PilF